MRNVVFGVCNGTIFVRIKIFTMRNPIFEFLMVKIVDLVMKSGSKGQLCCEKRNETAFFTMTKGDFGICNGKKCERVDFLTMRKVFWMNFMVKTGPPQIRDGPMYLLIYSSISPANFASFLMFFLETFLPQKSIKSLVSPLKTSHG